LAGDILGDELKKEGSFVTGAPFLFALNGEVSVAAAETESEDGRLDPRSSSGLYSESLS